MSYAKWLQANAPAYLQDEFGEAWMGGIGDVLNDYVSLIIAGVMASWPRYAPADAIPVIGDELQLDQGISETTADYATRLQAAFEQWRFAGTPLGLLLALHFLGFDGAVLVQQNGNAYQLTLPLPIFAPGWDPTGNLTITNLSTNPCIGVSPSWWTFDTDNGFCSRFAVLLPNGNGPSTASDVQRLQATIRKWRPAKATCTGIYVLVSGNFIGWPPRSTSPPAPHDFASQITWYPGA